MRARVVVSMAGAMIVLGAGCGGPQILPDGDEDGDGVLNDVDGCPNEAEDDDDFEDEDGCPDTDNDGDGHHDGYDTCPNEPEDVDGDHDEDGCPDVDTDGDGVDDRLDRCPEEAEDADGVLDQDGCPETDGDEDGVSDEDDECDTEPETLDGVTDDDGCPEETPVVLIEGNRMVVQVPFEYSRHAQPEGHDTIRAIQAIERLVVHHRLPASFGRLRVVVTAENEGRAEQRAHAIARIIHRTTQEHVEHAGEAGEEGVVIFGIAEE